MKKRGRRGPHNSRYEQLKTTLEIFFAMQRMRFGLTAPELAEESGASVRTVYRIVRALEQVGIKIERLRPHGSNSPWHFRTDPRAFAEMRIRRAL